MKTEKFHWGILSTARINRALIPHLQNSRHSDLQAVASRDLAKAQTYAVEKGIPKAYGSYEDLLADPEMKTALALRAVSIYP